MLFGLLPGLHHYLIGDLFGDQIGATVLNRCVLDVFLVYDVGLVLDLHVDLGIRWLHLTYLLLHSRHLLWRHANLYTVRHSTTHHRLLWNLPHRPVSLHLLHKLGLTELL